MKQHQINKNLLSIAIPTLAVALLGLTVAPVFATSAVSFPPWNTMKEQPSFDSGACTFSSQSCANARSSGVNSLIARSSTFVSGDALATNNEDKTIPSLGSTPQLTTSASTVKGKATISANGFITVAFLQQATYTFGGDLWKKSGSSWTYASGCYRTIGGNGAITVSSEVRICTYTNSGTNTFALGAGHEAQAPAYLIGPTNVVDLWSGSYYASTTKLEVCDNC